MRAFVRVLTTMTCLLAASAGTAAPAMGLASDSATRGKTNEPWPEAALLDLPKGSLRGGACVVLEDLAPRCFSTSRLADQWVASLGVPTLNCSTPLKLHAGTSQGGTLVSVYARGLWVNLSTFGFDNMTSSYTVGACAVELAAGAGGGGNHYTRCLSPGCVENSMLPGWDNVISSVFLH
jgi:hypothetical protein